MITVITVKDALGKMGSAKKRFKEITDSIGDEKLSMYCIGDSPPKGFASVNDCKKYQQATIDELAGLPRYIARLSSAISQSNSTTMITVEGLGTVTIAEARAIQEQLFPLSKRKERENRLGNISRAISDVRQANLKAMEKEKDTIDRLAEKFGQDSVQHHTDDNTRQTKKNDEIKKYTDARKVELVEDPAVNAYTEMIIWASNGMKLAELIESACQLDNLTTVIKVDLTGAPKSMESSAPGIL